MSLSRRDPDHPTALQFEEIVFAVVIPNSHPFSRPLTQQCAAGRHRDAFDHHQARLPGATGRHRAADGAALVMFAKKKLAWGKLALVEGRKWAQEKRRFRRIVF